jgi:hypothetical protein
VHYPHLFAARWSFDYFLTALVAWARSIPADRLMLEMHQVGKSLFDTELAKHGY